MKKAGTLILGTLLALSLSAAVPAAETEGKAEEKTVIKTAGISIDMPEEVHETKGYIEDTPLGALDEDRHVYMMAFYYVGMPADTVRTLLTSEDLTEEEIKDVQKKQTYLASVLATDKDLDTALKALEEQIGEKLQVDREKIEELGQGDGFTFFSVPFIKDGFDAAVGDEYAEEAEKLEQTLIAAEKEADFFEPEDLLKEMSGMKLQFTTKDLEGNTVTSEELFSPNKITMVNCWGTWCHFCVGEMAELAQIHTRIQEKGCGIVGMEFEYQYDEDTLAEAAQIMQENGTNYPNVIMPDEIMDRVMEFPTTFYVDSEGNILGIPVTGPAVDKYEKILDGYLAGGGTSAETEAEKSDTAASEDEAAVSAPVVYSVTVKDENGPVEGAVIQFCDDSSCSMETTDGEGVAKHEGPAGNTYEIHVLVAPEGYAEDETTYKLEGTANLDITLKKAE